MPRDQMANPSGVCSGTYACLAEYLEGQAAASVFRAFRPASVKELVYFIGAETGPIKIGITTYPKLRLEHLQTGSPVPLQIHALVRGGRSLERAYHEYFDRWRLHGEWFDRSPDLELEIRYWSARCRRIRP